MENNSVLVILDPGHGGLIKGVYQTPGKRSPKFDDGSVLYEGVNNRDNVNRFIAALKAEGIEVIDIVKSNKDVSLQKRVEAANELAKTRNCLYVSIHSDAAGDGVSWHPASGVSVYTSVGQTQSDKFAEIMIDELSVNFGSKIKWRVDKTDGDADKEENFYVLKNTTCPAVLIECGFHTNKAEATAMLTESWKIEYTKAVVSAIKKWIELNK